jgi:hypothetical protein
LVLFIKLLVLSVAKNQKLGALAALLSFLCVVKIESWEQSDLAFSFVRSEKPKVRKNL